MNFVTVHFRFAFYEGYNFYVSPPPKFSVLLFSHRRVMGFQTCHSWIGFEGKKCAAVEIYVIASYERFVKIWNLASFFLLENLCDVCLWKHRCVKIGAGLKNCSWGQVVTGAWILLSCILRLRYTKDTNLIFSPSNFQFLYFQIYEQWGLISCTHQSVSRAKNALQLRYKWFPAMRDLLRFEIWQVFFFSKIFVMCVYESIIALKLALG